jgi:superfamily II DNA/RNA helicase
LYQLIPLSNVNSRHPNLLKGIYAMKFQKPSKVQERALPLLVSNPYFIQTTSRLTLGPAT